MHFTHNINEPLQSNNPKYHDAHAIHFGSRGLTVWVLGHTSMACFSMDILVALCTSYIYPPGTNLFRVRIVKLWGFTLVGFTNIVCDVQIDNCIISTTSLSPPMLIFGREPSNRHKSLLKANLTKFLGMLTDPIW